jgi:alpha-ketoglutarate-dependent taurine dioxygenase
MSISAPRAMKRPERKSVTVAAGHLVSTRELLPGTRIPLLVEPAVEGLDLCNWATHHGEEVTDLLLAHRALLFRGFGISTPERFAQLVAATSEGEPLEYRDRSTPRTTVSTGVYVSTIYPEDQRIHMHNEGTYWARFARKLYFCCLEASAEGGETPIADVRRVFERIDPAVRQPFVDRQVMYVRNYNDGLGLPWQDVFQTPDRDEVEAYCRANAIECEWKDGDRLRTRQIRPAVRYHPVTGEAVWFNHAAFFHVTSQEPEMRQALLAEFKEEDLPYNTYYGDGGPIDPAAVEQIRRAYEQEKVYFPWQNGDVLLLDNLSVAHGREPYRGARRIVVSMTEPISG